jgi:predicted branched-subunit amino acid permease
VSVTGRFNPRTNQVDRTGISVAFTVGLYGAAFGAAGVTAGFSILQSCLLSILLFSGASQFAVVGIMGAGGSAISAIATATLLGFRNALYGLQMAPILKVTGLNRVLGDPAVWGLDAAVPAAFCGLVWPRLKNKLQFVVCASAIALALMLTPLTPAGVPIITTVLLAVIFGWKK